MVAYFVMRTYGVTRNFDLLKAVGYIERVFKSDFFSERPILHHTCATELSSYVSTMPWTGIGRKREKLFFSILIRSATNKLCIIYPPRFVKKKKMFLVWKQYSISFISTFHPICPRNVFGLIGKVPLF